MVNRIKLFVVLALLWGLNAANAEIPPIVKVDTPTGWGTGIVVRKNPDVVRKASDDTKMCLGMVATAYHVIADVHVGLHSDVVGKDEFGTPIIQQATQPGDITLQFYTGLRCRAKIVAVNPKYDLATLVCYVPVDITPMKLADEAPKPGEQVYFVGLGGGASITDFESWHTTSGEVAPAASAHTIFADAVVITGDSGGAICNKDGRLVGIISGGWIWIGGTNKTWPTRGGGLSKLRPLIKNYHLK